MANDRPPIVGTVGRNSGQIRMKVCDNTQQITIQPQVEVTTLPTTTVYTDESDAYSKYRSNPPQKELTKRVEAEPTMMKPTPIQG
ncbi:MAG: hypothetical protein M1G31_22740 [Pseudanabaena sp. Salubria-1]|nr:hypothetical protein [Pseudanabaena sp. Salubria-1]